MTSHTNPDPEPGHTPGLQPGGGVPPGESPPAEGGMSETGPRDITYNRPTGWAKAPLALIMFIVALFVIGLLGYAVAVWF